MLEDALKVIEAWNFEYKTIGFVWAKTNGNAKTILRYELAAKYPLLRFLKPVLNWITTGFFFGVGYYTKSNAEICLLATKGKVLKPIRNDVSSLIIAPRRKHSRKPWETHYRIEQMYPDQRKLELFAREKQQGWDSWGNEIKSDIALGA